MEFRSYQKKAGRTLDPTTPTGKALAHFALGLGGEAGEVLEPIKKFLFCNKSLVVGELAAELGDVLWYVAALCTTLGLDMGAVAEGNLRKLEERHPDKTDERRDVGDLPLSFTAVGCDAMSTAKNLLGAK